MNVNGILDRTRSTHEMGVEGVSVFDHSGGLIDYSVQYKLYITNIQGGTVAFDFTMKHFRLLLKIKYIETL